MHLVEPTAYSASGCISGRDSVLSLLSWIKVSGKCYHMVDSCDRWRVSVLIVCGVGTIFAMMILVIREPKREEKVQHKL